MRIDKDKVILSKKELESIKNLNSFSNRKIIKILFAISIGFNAVSIGMCIYSTSINMITLSIASSLLTTINFVILFARKANEICSSCRRVQIGGKWYPIETFMGSLSHSICPICAGITKEIWTAGQKEIALNTSDIASLTRKRGEIRLGDLLVFMGEITERQLVRALIFQEKFPKLQVGDILVQSNLISREVLKQALEEQENLKRVSRQAHDIANELHGKS